MTPFGGAIFGPSGIIWTNLVEVHSADMLSFWKKMWDNLRKICDFFKTRLKMLFAFPMSTDVVNPAVRYAEMLTANLAERLWLALVAGHNPVKRSCIFCIKIWPASIPYSFFCWANPWRWFAFRHLCWIYQVIQPLGLFVPALFGLHLSP